MAVSLLDKTITNAAGMVKTEEQARKLLRSAVTRITIGSVKYDPWPGNTGETYYFDPVTKTAWNSKGLPDLGWESLMRWLPAFYEECKAAGKELVVNIAAKTADEYAKLAAKIWRYCDKIEINVGCGNVWGSDNTQMPIPSYEPVLFRRIIEAVAAATGHFRALSVKLSPVPDDLIKPLADVLELHPVVVEAITCNTKILQDGTREDGSHALAFYAPGSEVVNHLGGMSGRALKADSMRVLAGFRKYLPKLRYIGCGGIFDGRDALDYLELGAAGIAIGTAYFESNEGLFSRILQEAA